MYKGKEMIIPRNGDYIRHERFLDAAILVTNIFMLGHKWKVKGMWVNMAFVDTFALNMRARIEISTNDLNEWEICLEPNVNCIRYSKWKALK